MRLIDRQAVIDALWNIQRGLQMMDSERVDKTIHGIQLALHTIEQMPTVDAVPVRHGRWITPEGHENARVCSQCKMICHADNAMFYAYCPNCGAKMDKGEE